MTAETEIIPDAPKWQAGDAVLVVEGVSKAYKRYPSKWARIFEWLTGQPHHQRTEVLRDINFTLMPGESIGIVGVNGAGKSTLLKIVTGTTAPTTGRVLRRGRIAALLELGMGFHPDFTGRQNAYMAGQLLGIRTEEIDAAMPAIEAFAEIGSYIDQPVRMYSSGMQMRLAFSVATAVRPDVLIVDEALSVGDAYFQAKCYTRIQQFRDQGTTLLLVSHSAGDVVKHCDRALMLRGGQVVHDGPSREVTNFYLDELFGRKPESESLEAAPLAGGWAASVELAQVEDRFHTHPGYRADEHRWGQGGAAIVDFCTVSGPDRFPSRITSGSLLEVYFTVRFDIDVASAVAGLLIKTLEGIFLYGTNSFISSDGRATISARAGEVHQFRFVVPMNLNEGHYLMSLGISTGEPTQELVPLDRRYDAVLLHVGRAFPFWGIVDLHASFDSRVERQAEVTS